MSRIEKRVENWKTTKQEAELEEVISVLDKYFNGYWYIKGGTGSHNLYLEHPSMKLDGRYGPLGQLLIPTVSGRKVKPYYLKKIIEAINLLEDYDEKES